MENVLHGKTLFSASPATPLEPSAPGPEPAPPAASPTPPGFPWMKATLGVLCSLLIGVGMWSVTNRATDSRPVSNAASMVRTAVATSGTLMSPEAWVRLLFGTAMGLLIFINWPQVRKNFLLFGNERRGPRGVASLHPATVILGSLLHLTAALSLGDAFWAVNSTLAVATASVFMSQILFPSLTYALLRPVLPSLIRIEDGLHSLFDRIFRRASDICCWSS